MAGKVKVKLLKPLDGMDIGAEAEFDEADFNRLEEQGAVQRVKSEAAPKNKSAAAPANKGRKAK